MVVEWKNRFKSFFQAYLKRKDMDQSFSSTGRISLAYDVVPRLLYTDGKTYLDFHSIKQICGGEAIAKTTLFCLLKELPNLEENMIKYRNRSYFEETYILVHLKNLIFDQDRAKMT